MIFLKLKSLGWSTKNTLVKVATRFTDYKMIFISESVAIYFLRFALLFYGSDFIIK